MHVEEILGKMIEFPFFMYCILLLSRLRPSRKTALLATAAVAVPYMVITYLVIRNWHYVIYTYPALDLAYRIANILLMALAALCLTRQRIVQSLFIMASTYVTITIIDVLSVACLLAAGVPELAAKCLLYLILSLLVYRARKPFTGILNQTKKGWWLLCSVPLFLIVEFLLLSALPVTLAQNPSGMPAALIACGTTIIIYITFFYMMWEMYKQNQLEQNVMALRLSVSALEHQNELIQQNEKQYALLRHDLRHFTQMMQDCLEQNDTASLQKLLAALSQGEEANPHGGPIRALTGNKLLDALVHRYRDQAHASGVEMIVRMEPLDSVTADSAELAVVLANALENAVRACQTATPGRPREVRLDGRRRGTQYFLEIVNTFNIGSVYIDPETGLPSGGGARRGLGCQSIAFFAQKYGAVLQYQIEGEWMHLRLLL